MATFSDRSPGSRTYPWRQGQPIFTALRAWDGTSPFDLPDEQPVAADTLRFASGAWDGIATHHLARTDERSEARVVYGITGALKRLVKTADDDTRARLYDLLLQESVVPYADTIVEELNRQKRLKRTHLRPHARWLVHASAHREPLKLGIILLGLSGTSADLPDLRVLARHDEFTLFAVVAAASLLADPIDLWWEMAREVHGWGKIHAVERLCERVGEREDVQAWLLRHGCANEIMPEYLAYRCATAGRLAEALAESDPDDDLLDGACTIIGALLSGGPAEDMDGYADGLTAVRHLLRHFETRCTSLSRLHLVQVLLQWLEWPDSPPQEAEKWQRRADQGWTETVRADLAGRCREVLGRPEWHEKVRSACADGDGVEATLGWGLAAAVGVDVWEDGFARLEADPLDAGLYWNLLHTEDLARVRRVLALAEARLPLTAVATGPDSQLGLGPEFQAHVCVTTLVQEMRREGVFSQPLVAAALRSPVLGNRNAALMALESHPTSLWGPGVHEALRRTLNDEPNEEIRQRLEVLVGKVA